MEEDEIQTEHLSSDRTWVECRSKRHFGRIYFFNKATGEATWNLSESEINKARKESLKYGKQFQQAHSWPEPKDPPLDQNSAGIQRVYNKQIINQFRQPFESVAYHQLMPSMPIGPMGLQTYSIPNQFNSNVWAIPPMHQIYITPPLVNQVIQPPNYPQSNFIENEVSQNTCPSETSETSARSDQIERQMCQSPSPPRYQQNKPISNIDRHTMKQTVRKTRRFKAGQTDLRQVLAEKRKHRELAEKHQIIPNRKTKAEDRGTVYLRPKSRSTIDSNDDYPQTDVDCDGDWLEENTHVCGTNLKLNLTNLKNLARPDANTNVWYIVADRDIYLKHLNFLNILLNSDEQCHLIMPREVFSLLQAIVDSGQHRRMVNRARRAIALFKELLDAKVAVVADSSDRSEDVLGCCQNLAGRNYHVILLSNDTTLHEHKSEPSIPIFTINEIKKYISDSTTDEDNVSEMPVPVPIMVTIDNDLNTAQTVDLGVQIDNQECALERPHTMIVNSDMCDGKSITDVGVQADLGSWETSDLGTSLPSSQEHSCKAVQTDYKFRSQNNTDNKNFVKSEQNSIPCNLNKREIRLNRNTANPASKTNIEVKKRQFKWRTRKNTTSQPSTTSNFMPNDTNKGTESPAKLSESNTQFKITENVESNQASSLSHHTIRSWNMVLEETSTSGVISNSSDVEFERPNQLYTYHQGSKLTENVIFEVSDENMVRYLKIKQDEWVSRFVQIMEEILTQVLQKDPPFCNENIPAPWAIQEAAECIKLKFSNRSDVVKTAQGFIDILYQISDNGRIKVDLLPQQFMEMYSFGVHLVKIMQTVIGDCEDIATALDLLSRLLTDIRNPNIDSSSHDSFGNMQGANITHVSHVSTNDTLTRVMDIAIDDIIDSHMDISDIQTPDFESFGDTFHTDATCNSENSGNALGKTQRSCENSTVAKIDSIFSELPNQTKNDNVYNTFKSPSLNPVLNSTLNSGGSSKLDFTFDSPHESTYHKFDSQSLLRSPQIHNALQYKLNNSVEIARNVTMNSDQCQKSHIIDNETLKTTKDQIAKNDSIIPDSKIDTETPKNGRSLITNPVIDALKPRKIDILNPSPLSANAMDEIFDYDEDCCLEDSHDTRDESVVIQNEPTVSDDNEKASRYCKLVQELAKIVCKAISFCKGFKLDMKNEHILLQTQIKAKKIGLMLLDVWKATERISRRKSGGQALPSNLNRAVLMKCCDQAVVAIKWLNQINTHINTILRSD